MYLLKNIFKKKDSFVFFLHLFLRGFVVPNRSGSNAIKRLFNVRLPTPCGPIKTKHFRANGGIRATS